MKKIYPGINQTVKSFGEMKSLILLPVLLLLAFPQLMAQPISLQKCYEWATAAHPLPAQRLTNEALAQRQLNLLDIQRMPTIDWQAQATYQSESVSVPFDLPNGERIEQPRLNGQTTLEATYLLYDGGRNDAARETIRSQLAVNQQQLAVELYQLKQRINHVYFGLLLSRAQDSILLASRQDFLTRLSLLEAGEREGVVLPSEVAKVRLELLRLDSRRDNLHGQARSLQARLKALVGRQLPDSLELSIPDLPPISFSAEVERPELTLFDLQRQQVLSQQAQIDAQRKPQLSAFVRAGAGYANPLNFFDKDLSPFALAGVQFRWQIVDWGRHKEEQEILQLQTQLIDQRRATFLYNLQDLDGRYAAEAEKLQQLIRQERNAYQLQQEIQEQTAAQLEHGIVTASEYIIQANAGIQILLNLRLYELQLIELQVEYLTEKGNR